MGTYYFLGANTADGFYSLYDGMVSFDKGDFLWVIKGGAGCGKSGFMREIGAAAERRGLDVDYIVCSGDPDSLDGVYIPALKTAYMDGTAPHIADTNLTAVNSSYLDLGQFYDIDKIAAHRDELLALNAGVSAQYKKAYALLAAAGALKRGWLGTMAKQSEIDAATRRVSGVIKRELGTRHRSGGRVIRRFFSAVTCKGVCSFPDSCKALCGRFYVLESRLGLAGPMLGLIAQSAADSGFEVYVSPDPLTPELPEAVLIPSAGLGFVSKASALALLPAARNFHLDAKSETATQKSKKSELQRCEGAVTTLKNEAIAALAQAKALHDRLEKIYNPYVDFEGVRALAREHIHRLGLDSDGKID